MIGEKGRAAGLEFPAPNDAAQQALRAGCARSGVAPEPARLEPALGQHGAVRDLTGL